MTSTRSDHWDDFDDDLDLLLDSAELRNALRDAEVRSELMAALVARRKEVGLRQREVADRMETTQSAVSEFEAGSTDPFLSTLQRYARAVNASISVELRGSAEGNVTPLKESKSVFRGEYMRRSFHLVRERPKVYRGVSGLTGSTAHATAKSGKLLKYTPREQVAS